jgi:hypothetical protein
VTVTTDIFAVSDSAVGLGSMTDFEILCTTTVDVDVIVESIVMFWLPEPEILVVKAPPPRGNVAGYVHISSSTVSATQQRRRILTPSTPPV